MTDLKTEKPRHREGWYWQPNDEGPAYGPFETREAAVNDMWDDGYGPDAYEDLCAYLKEEGEPVPTKESYLEDYEYVYFMSAGPISTECFVASDVLARFEEHNEDQVWYEAPPEWTDTEALRELEAMLADTLYRWAEKHDAWKQFRALS